MFKPILTASLCLACQSVFAADLSTLEQRWLAAAAPVLAYSHTLKLPIDVIVQAKARADDVPLAMGFEGKRCKLVLSVRGNPDAQAVFARVPEAAQAELIEAMAAHEVGHCWRYAKGAWHVLPAGFVEVGQERAADPALLAASKAMRQNRREEGYADLVALAWTRRRHPEHYVRVYRWLAALRADQPVARNAHDTRAWVRLARDARSFGKGSAPFDDVAPLWRAGLLSAD